MRFRRRKTSAPLPTGTSWASGRYRSRVEYEVAGPITFDNADEIAAWCMAVVPGTEVHVRRDWPERAVWVDPTGHGYHLFGAGEHIACRPNLRPHERWTSPNFDLIELLDAEGGAS